MISPQKVYRLHPNHRNYLNEYNYGNGLIAFNSRNNPNPWNIRPDVNFYHKDVLGSITATQVEMVMLLRDIDMEHMVIHIRVVSSTCRRITTDNKI